MEKYERKRRKNVAKYKIKKCSKVCKKKKKNMAKYKIK